MAPKIALNDPLRQLAECIDMDDNDVPRLKVVCCGVEADGTVTPIKVNSAGEIVIAT